MNSPIEKIKRTVRYFFYKYKNNWHFPPKIAHLTGGKMANGTYEPSIRNLIERNLKCGGVFLDIGANIGYFSRFASNIVGESGHVFSFEPEHFNYHALCRNTVHLENVTPFHFAVSNDHTLLNFFSSSHASSHSIFDTSKNLDGSKFTVPSFTLDFFWLTYLGKKEISLIKIDVEGAEILVLQGMEKMLSENKVAAIILEFHPGIIQQARKKYQVLYSLVSKNFDIFLLNKEGENSIQLNSNEQFNKATQSVLEQNEGTRLNFFLQRKVHTEEINH